ncbi:hypothetical protein BH09BAC2_BH09BAC2_02590 [soil metagenome]
MKFLFVCFLLLSSTFVGFSQTTPYIVTGKIIDKNTKQALPGASVFAQNTTLGVATATDGSFTLKLPGGGYDLIITFTGYETENMRISNSSSNDPLNIELAPRERSLQEVAIVSSNEVRNGWEKYGQFFTENFVGKTARATQTTIKNPEALKFYYSKKKNRLKVLSEEPVTVINNALGYSIKFAIDSFIYEYGTHTNIFAGYPLFEDLQGTPEQIALWKQNRAEAYKGSMLHFMRSLFDKNLTAEGFEVQFVLRQGNHQIASPVANIYGALNYDKDDSTNTIEFYPNQPEVAILYTKAKPEAAYQQFDPGARKNFRVSYLTFSPQKPITIEQNGYFFEQEDMIVNGYWGFEKIADMLPYDYNP